MKFHVAYVASDATTYRSVLGSVAPARFSRRIGRALEQVAVALAHAFRAEASISCDVVVTWGFYADPCMLLDIGIAIPQIRGRFFSLYSDAPGYERPRFRGRMDRDAVVEWLEEFAVRFRDGLPHSEARSFEYIVRGFRRMREFESRDLITYCKILKP
ncbi:hypothetical protein HYW67_03120 [Candidatus Parcubacteria bacterium]|nr:hypothetical protein [Candidatus Parcubacteria bacterium]